MKTRRNSGFTLTEILIVIGLIVLILGIAVAALPYMTGSNSLEGAQNNLSAFLGRARQEAIALNTQVGIVFYVDTDDQTMTMRMVADDENTRGDATNNLDPRHWDLVAVPDRDAMKMPADVGLHLINDPSYDALSRNFVPFGVVMFDTTGKLKDRYYYIDSGTPLSATTRIAMSDIARTSLGFALYDPEPLHLAEGNSQFNVIDQNGDSVIDADDWISQNAAPLVVNRYNGTLIKGE